jgi:hypothetical protein
MSGGFIGLAFAICALLSVSAASAAPSTDPRRHVQGDLDAVYQGLEQAHYDLFARRTRAEYDQLYRTLSEQAAHPMTPVEAEVLLQRFVAFGRIGHARIDAPIVRFARRVTVEGGRFIPLFIRVDEGPVRLTLHAAAGDELVPGMELVALNGEPIGIWLERAGALVSAEGPEMTYAQLEQTFPAILWLLLGEVAQVEVQARDGSGRLVQAIVPSVTAAERRALAARAPRLGVDFNAREFRMLDAGVGYLRPGPFAQRPDEAPGDFLRFVDESFRALMAAGASDLVLDLRNNGGGDNSFSDPIVAWFAERPFRFASSFRLKASPQAKSHYARLLAKGEGDEMLVALAQAEAVQPNGARYDFDLPLNPPRPEPRFEGRVYVLVNRHSYSNAASVAALIQDYGFGEIVGEETADVPTTYASVQSFDLPSGIAVTYPKSRIVRPSGDQQLLGVRPDLSIAREPIATAEDAVLDQTLALVRSRRDPGTPSSR